MGADDFIEAGESALTYDRNGRAYESRFEKMGRKVLADRASDPETFERILSDAFGDFDRTAAEGLRRKIVDGDFSWAPPVYLVGSETLGDQTGAYYSGAKPVVYLHEQLPSRYFRYHVYLEELGHHIETMLKVSDTPGDEGALFRMSVVGETFIPLIHERFRRDDHRGTIIVDGLPLDVEFFGIPNFVRNAARRVSDAGKAAWGGIKDATNWFTNSAKSAGEALREYASKGLNASMVAAEWVAEHADVALDTFVEECKRQGTALAQTAINAANMAYAALHGTWDGADVLLQAVGELQNGNFVAAAAALGVGLAKIAVEMPFDVLIGASLESIAALQTALHLEPVGRFLRGDERAFLATVFGGPQWWFHVIRVKEGFAGVFSISSRPFTLESTIYLKKEPYTPRLLVHEVTHAWQWFSGGGDYKIASIHEQYIKRSGYDFEPALNEGKTWGQLGVEQQAKFVDNAFAQNCFANPQALCFVNMNDRTVFFQNVREALLHGRGAP